MDLDQLKKILDLVREHELAEFEIEQEGLRLKVRKDTAGTLMTLPAAAPPNALPVAPPPAHAAAPVTTPPGCRATPTARSSSRSSSRRSSGRSTDPRSRGAASFVEIGSTVKKGQVLCIIEAMKLMNEIDSEYEGEVVNVYVENGQPVQYGERLFAIRTK